MYGFIHVDRAVAARMERAQACEQAATARAWGARHPESGACVETVAGGSLIYAWVDSPITKAEALGLDGAVSAAELDQVEAFFRSRGAAVRVTISAFTDASLVALLGDRGYRVEELEQLLVRRLKAFERFAEETAGVAVERVGGDDRGTWARVVWQGFAGRDDVADDELAVGHLLAGPAGAELWLARVDGEPAGAGVVASFDGVASFYGTSTRVGYRGRGVQTALLRSRLDAAVAMGCDLAIVMTAAGSQSQRNVERAGFRVAYTKVTMIEPDPRSRAR